MSDFEEKRLFGLKLEIQDLTSWMFEQQMIEKKTDGSFYVYFVPCSGMDADFEIIHTYDDYGDECLNPTLIRFTDYNGIQCISDSKLNYENLSRFVYVLKNIIKKECAKRTIAILKEMREKVYGDVEGNQDCYTFVQQGEDMYFEYFNNHGKQFVLFGSDGTLDGVIRKKYGVNSFGCLKYKFISDVQKHMDVYEEIKEDLNHVVLPWTGKTSPVNFE